MSGFAGVSNLIPSVQTGPDWLSQLRPASFRGAPFYVDEASYEGGRRLDTKEFYKRNNAYSEDLGRSARRFRLRAYVIGSGYMAARDALERAIEGYDTAALLVHPYRGNIMCRSGRIVARETKSEGGWCSYDIEFVQDGQQPAPASSANTASGLLGGLASLLPVIQSGYALASLVASDPGVLLGFTEQLLGGAAASFLGLPATTFTGLELLAASWAATPSDTATTALNVSDSFDGAAGNVIAAVATAATAPVDAITGSVPSPAPADFTGGLAALATYGDAVPPIASLAAFYGGPELVGDAAVLPPGVPVGFSGYTGPTDPTDAPTGIAPLAVQQAVTQQAVVDLVEGAATYGVISVASQTTFEIADDADAARALILALLDRRIYAAAASSAWDLYRAWQSMVGLAVADLIARAQGLPSRAPYALPVSLPAAVLAQRFYVDATRADQLVALNDWPHPLFMPAVGIRLTS